LGKAQLSKRQKKGSRTKSAYPAPTSKHFSGVPAYKRLVYILQHSASNKEAAARIGVSDRTIRRWKALGIPDKSIKQHAKRLREVSYQIQRKEQNIPPSSRPEPRPVYYYREFGGIRTKYWIVEGLPYDAILEILMRECLKEIYSGYTLLLKVNVPFEGVWLGDDVITRQDLEKTPLRDRRKIREAGSWVEVTMQKPYISTKIYPLIPGFCHPDDFADTVSHFYGSSYLSIYEIRLKEWRRYEEDEE
jgi:hypothetical protein